MATHSSILAEKSPWTRVAWQAINPWDHKESDMTEQTGKDGLDWWFSVKEPACHCRRSLGWQDPLDKGMAACSSILAGGIPWTEEPGGLQAMGSQRIGPDTATP